MLERFDKPAETPAPISNEVGFRKRSSYEDWYSYQDTFEKLIHSNESLATIEKFHYLRSSLKDRAAEVIRSIEITTDNYPEVWAAIKDRFDNKRWIIHKHIKAMFEAPSLTKENHIALRELLDTISKHLRALKALKRPTDTWDDVVIHIITSKLDSATNKAWETSIVQGDMPNLKSLTDFLSKRCQALESISSNWSSNQQGNVSQKYGSKHKNQSVSNVATSNISCPQCKENHSLYHCEAFRKLSVDKRLQVVKKAHICTNCLRSTEHQASACKSGACRKCNKRHNTLLHLSNPNNDNKSVESKESLADSNEASQAVVTQCLSAHHSLNILLSTAIVYVYDSKEQPISCRVLLDSGSQMNFITDELANQLHLKEQSVEASITGVMQKGFHAKRMISLRVKSRFNNFSEVIDCIVLPKITQQLPQKFTTKSNIVIPKHIKLADPNFNIPSSIDMLIGAELFWRLICAGQIRHSKNQPILQKTRLGWIISGHIMDNDINLISTSCNLAVTDDLNRALSRFWEVEHNILTSNPSPEESRCELIFQGTTRRNEEGRFIVQLPIRMDKLTAIGDSRDIALKRFKLLERRFAKQPQMHAEYKKLIHEYKELGHMREVPNHLDSKISNANIPTYYLPHHAVYKETSTTTKLRVVFDGSCKTSTGTSLNDVLMVGPTIQEDLFSILSRFRTFTYVLTADVVKMYRQVLIDPTQTCLQRILWRDSPNESIKTFELLTLTYGTSSASFLAIAALRRQAEENSNKFPIASKVVLNDFYVDDLVTGANTIQEICAIKRETIQLLQEAKFELAKWASNVPSLRDNQSHSNHKEFILSADKQCETRTLGIT
ncbi:PREDICTED: uncharacterized protein LOC105555686 [Vollenhovia emeryi]|uniref:uncharacterized protein LOC105555686 n=1 Tax=Vollenhovia emeryi TaxID=411798 RepID=UPI0005F52442|nr:PREDICTED: uncharacterized protein LOC105555686 [Vollenhovia emeryi]